MNATPNPNWNRVIRKEAYKIAHEAIKIAVEWKILAEFMTTACKWELLGKNRLLKSQGTPRQNEMLKLFDPTALLIAMEP